MPSQVDPRENAQRLREQVRKLRAEALRAGDAETRRRLLLQSRETIAEAERAELAAEEELLLVLTLDAFDGRR